MEDLQFAILRLASFNVQRRHRWYLHVYVHVYSKTGAPLGLQSSLSFKF